MASIKIEDVKETELTELSGQEPDFVVGGGWFKKLKNVILGSGLLYVGVTIPF